MRHTLWLEILILLIGSVLSTLDETISPHLMSLNNLKVTILMMESIHRPSFHDIQSPNLESYQGIELKLYKESMIPTCVLCNSSLHNSTNIHGWRCAQKHHILALQDYLFNNSIPDFMLIVRDNTFVSVKNLMNLVKGLNANDELYLVHEHNARLKHMVMGGGSALISRSVLEKMNINIAMCVNNAQGGKWCHYLSESIIAACIEELSQTKNITSLLFKHIHKPTDCDESHVTCYGIRNGFELGQIYIAHGLDSSSRKRTGMEFNSISRIGLLQYCDFYVPLDSDGWPGRSHFYEDSTISILNSDYQEDMTKLIDLFNLKYHRNETKFRVLYDDTNYCSDCYPVITKSRTVACGLNVVSWIHYHRHFTVLNNDGVNMLQKFDIPYLQKNDIAIWRGTSTGAWGKPQFVTMKDYHDFSRQIFVSKYYNSSYPIDIGLSYCANQTDECPNVNEFIKGEKSIKELLENKFLISLEGNDVASGLKWMLASNSVVFMPIPTMESWVLEGQLQPWVHFVPLMYDGSDLMEKILHAIANPHQMMSIVKNANGYIENFMNFYSQEEQAVEDLKHYSDHVHITPANTKPYIKCDSKFNSSWLYNSLKNCNLEFY